MDHNTKREEMEIEQKLLSKRNLKMNKNIFDIDKIVLIVNFYNVLRKKKITN